MAEEKTVSGEEYRAMSGRSKKPGKQVTVSTQPIVLVILELTTRKTIHLKLRHLVQAHSEVQEVQEHDLETVVVLDR